MSEHQAGRELDALVAERVMGMTVGTPINVVEDAGEWYDIDGVPVPHFSTDIAAAMKVFLHFENVYTILAHVPRLSLGWTLGQPLEWHCTIYAMNTQKADTLPLAVCRAALVAIRGDD
jgi:hypothetical protein